MPLHWILALLLGIPPLPITFRISAPAWTSPADTLYLAGDQPAFGNGDPSGVRLLPLGGGIHEATVRLAPGTAFEFAVTRGSWESMEADERGEPVPYRKYLVSVVDTVRVSVAGWLDAPRPESPDTLGGERHRRCGGGGTR